MAVATRPVTCRFVKATSVAFSFFFYIDFIPIENNVSLARDVP